MKFHCEDRISSFTYNCWWGVAQVMGLNPVEALIFLLCFFNYFPIANFGKFIAKIVSHSTNFVCHRTPHSCSRQTKWKTSHTYQLLQTKKDHEQNNNRCQGNDRIGCSTFYCCKWNKANINITTSFSTVHQYYSHKRKLDSLVG